jgi:hypothetical protein
VDETLPAAWTSVFTRAIPRREVRYLFREKRFGDIAAFTAELLAVSGGRDSFLALPHVNKVSEPGSGKALRGMTYHATGWTTAKSGFEAFLFSPQHPDQLCGPPTCYPIENHGSSPRDKTDSPSNSHMHLWHGA